MTRIDQSTGKVVNSFGQQFDLALVQNDTERTAETPATPASRYPAPTGSRRGWTSAATTRCRTRGATSRARTSNSGPIDKRGRTQYPEYKQASWNYPEGDLQIDQRHRSRLWLNYGVPKLDGMTLSVLQTLESGVPYGASNLNGATANGVNPRPFVTVPGFAYVQPARRRRHDHTSTRPATRSGRKARCEPTSP